MLVTSLWALAALAPTLSSAARHPVKRDYVSIDYYVVEHDASSAASIDQVAAALGATVIEPAGELPNHWLLGTPKTLFTRRGDDDPVLARLRHLRRVASETPQRHDVRALGGIQHAKRVTDSVLYIERQVLRQRIKRDGSNLAHEQRAPPPIPPPATDDSGILKSAEVAAKFHIKDPIFGDQWHLVDDEFPRYTMNVTPVWAAGITGKGVTVAMVDDGVDFESEDLAANFVRIICLLRVDGWSSY